MNSDRFVDLIDYFKDKFRPGDRSEEQPGEALRRSRADAPDRTVAPRLAHLLSQAVNQVNAERAEHPAPSMLAPQPNPLAHISNPDHPLDACDLRATLFWTDVMRAFLDSGALTLTAPTREVESS